jgi:hypothetical protein
MKMKTIKTENSFGKEIELTKEQFVKRWRSWAMDFYNLESDFNKASNFVKQVESYASNVFDKETQFVEDKVENLGFKKEVISEGITCFTLDSKSFR